MHHIILCYTAESSCSSYVHTYIIVIIHIAQDRFFFLFKVTFCYFTILFFKLKKESLQNCFSNYTRIKKIKCDFEKVSLPQCVIGYVPTYILSDASTITYRCIYQLSKGTKWSSVLVVVNYYLPYLSSFYVAISQNNAHCTGYLGYLLLGPAMSAYALSTWSFSNILSGILLIYYN